MVITLPTAKVDFLNYYLVDLCLPKHNDNRNSGTSDQSHHLNMSMN